MAFHLCALFFTKLIEYAAEHLLHISRVHASTEKLLFLLFLTTVSCHTVR